MYKLLDEIDNRDAIRLLHKHLDRFRPASNNVWEWFYNIVNKLGLSVGLPPRSKIWVAEYFHGDSMHTLFSRSDPVLFIAVAKVAVEQELDAKKELKFKDDHRITDNLMVWVPQQKYLIRCQSYDNYWNNRLGWVDKGLATEFSESDTEQLNLPIDGMWEGTGEWV